MANAAETNSDQQIGKGASVEVKTLALNIEPAIVGVNVLIAPIADKIIRVLGYDVDFDAQATAFFASSGGSQISSKGHAIFGGAFTAPAGSFLFETLRGEGLDINIDTAVNSSVSLVYLEV